MSAEQASREMSPDQLPLNQTLEGAQEQMDTAFEVRVFNIVIISLALCVLTITGVYCITVCYSRTRQSKRAQVYESAVTRDEPVNPVAVKAVKRSTSFVNPLAFFRRGEEARDNSRIYYIYSNPLPVGVKEEEEAARRPVLSVPLSIEEYAKDPNTGIVLDPPVFYMQL
ncbi:uncharacterized protein ACB058_014035 [Synchiropus picturatus]